MASIRVAVEAEPDCLKVTGWRPSVAMSLAPELDSVPLSGTDETSSQPLWFSSSVQLGAQGGSTGIRRALVGSGYKN